VKRSLSPVSQKRLNRNGTPKSFLRLNLPNKVSIIPSVMVVMFMLEILMSLKSNLMALEKCISLTEVSIWDSLIMEGLKGKEFIFLKMALITMEISIKILLSLRMEITNLRYCTIREDSARILFMGRQRRPERITLLWGYIIMG